MKKVLFFAVFVMTFGSLTAQKTNLIFFTEGGERIYVVLNSVLQNSTAETNVLVTDLPAPNYKLKIIFEDSTITPLEKNLMFNQGTETTFNIKKNNKDEFIVRYLNEVPITQAPVPPATQTVVVFSASGPAAPFPPVAITTVSTTQTTTTTAGGTVPVEGVSMGVSVGDGQQNLNMNVNVSGTNTNMTGTSTTSSYSSTTTTTTTGVNTQPVYVPPQPSNPLPGYTGAVGCPYPMSPNDFEALKGSISSKSFDDSKLTLAKQVIATNCLMCSQVREVMLLFSFEDTKLELAKYAYGYTYDLGNYFKVNDAFTFESSIEELNEYITGISK
ncbi:MAG: DUF4476 domain-containing protein [Bacteroidota bacterium]